MIDEQQDDHIEYMKRRRATYKPDALPESITRRLYVSYGMGRHNAGQIEVNDFDYRGSDGFERVPLCVEEITINIPPPNDLKKKAVEVLEEQKKDIHAKYHQELHAVQDKIDSLLAIEYKPEELAGAEKGTAA